MPTLPTHPVSEELRHDHVTIKCGPWNVIKKHRVGTRLHLHVCRVCVYSMYIYAMKVTKGTHVIWAILIACLSADTGQKIPSENCEGFWFEVCKLPQLELVNAILQTSKKSPANMLKSPITNSVWVDVQGIEGMYWNFEGMYSLNISGENVAGGNNST